MNYMVVGVVFLIVVIVVVYLLYGQQVNKQHMTGGNMPLIYGGAVKELVSLDDSNHDEVVNTPGKTVMVKYYADWCGHCKTMAPEWQALASSNDNPQLIVAEAESNNIPMTSQKMGIRGFPTIKMWKDGQPYDVNVPRTVSDWKSYVDANM